MIIKLHNLYSDDEVINCLNELGLTKYEAKVYLSLLRNNLSYGSEIQKNSGVPGPKIYETLNTLTEKGIVYPSGDNPIRYQPLPLEDFVNNNLKKFKRINNYLLEHKNDIGKKTNPDWLWQIQGYENLMDKANELIKKAKNVILVSFWYSDGLKVQEQLENAVKRGVKVISSQMSDNVIPIGQVFRHVNMPIVEDVHSSEFVFVIDDLYCMFVYKNNNNRTEGYYTSNLGIVKLIENYIRHDIYINRLIMDFKNDVIEKYGENLEGLRTF